MNVESSVLTRDPKVTIVSLPSIYNRINGTLQEEPFSYGKYALCNKRYIGLMCYLSTLRTERERIRDIRQRDKRGCARGVNK